MRTRPAYLRLALFAALLAGGGVLLASMGWPQPDHTRELAVLIFAAIFVSAVAVVPSTAEDRGMMTSSFVVDFAALLLLGGDAAMLVAAVGIATRSIRDREGSRIDRRTIANAVSVLLATETAAVVHGILGGTLARFAWPRQSVPITAAVVAYVVVKGVWAELIAPVIFSIHSSIHARAFDGAPVSSVSVVRGMVLGGARALPHALLRSGPHYVIGGTMAVGLVELVGHGRWDVLSVAVVPLYCAYRAYCGDLVRLEDEHRRREVVDSLDTGLSVLDHTGRVIFWNDVLERITGRTRARARDRLLVDAIGELKHTPLAHAVEETMVSRRAQTLAHVQLSPTRVFEVKIVPVADGLTLVWHDMTTRWHAEQALKRSEERLTLAANGANDGLWEWDLHTQAFYASARWKAMLGLQPDAIVARVADWLTRVHQEDKATLNAALDAHVAGTTGHVHQEHRLRHEDGTYRRFLCHGVAARTASGRPTRIAGSLTDTTEQASAQEQLRLAGYRDPLTGLGNRAVFVERLGTRLTDFKRQHGARDCFAVLYLDLDRFKVVNDSLGHMVGDELLTAVSRRLESCLRPDDALARLGGDEFAILLDAIGDPQQANAVAFRIQDALAKPFSIGGREVFSSASIGIAFGEGHYDNPDDIMRDADTAMYHAKARGKARHELFDADMHARTRDRLGLENDLRHAISTNDFEVQYQPIVSLSTRMCVGFESLIRWTRNGEPVSPAVFIPMVEELGLIEPLGTWVLEQACQTFAGWQRQFPDAGLDCITVNVSSRQLVHQHFMLIVEEAVRRSGLRPCDLRLEITETALMDSPAIAAKLLSELRAFGVKIYLDDFGTGYSSLSHLHKLPVDALKIDRSFVRSLDLPDRPAIVESILALARTLNTSVVAEGIETHEQARELERLGCTHAQGFLFSRALTSRAVELLLEAGQPLGPQEEPPPALTVVKRFGYAGVGSG